MVHLVAADDACLCLECELLLLLEQIPPTGDALLEGGHQVDISLGLLVLIWLVSRLQPLLLLELLELQLLLTGV